MGLIWVVGAMYKREKAEIYIFLASSDTASYTVECGWFQQILILY